jgi:hypothetical protein
MAHSAQEPLGQASGAHSAQEALALGQASGAHSVEALVPGQASGAHSVEPLALGQASGAHSAQERLGQVSGASSAQQPLGLAPLVALWLGGQPPEQQKTGFVCVCVCPQVQV